MAEIKKLTKREKFAMMREYVADNEILMEFIDNEIALLEKKANSNTKTKVQVENEAIKDKIVEYLTQNKNKQYTVTEFQLAFKDMGEYSNQKMSALFTQLKNEARIVRIQDKKKTYFTVDVA